MKCFMKIVYDCQSLIIFLKSSFLDIWKGFQYKVESISQNQSYLTENYLLLSLGTKKQKNTWSQSVGAYSFSYCGYTKMADFEPWDK